MRLIRAIKPFFAGDTMRLPNSEPFEIDRVRARDLVDQGLAQFVVELPELQMAIAPGPAAAERAVTPRQRKRA